MTSRHYVACDLGAESGRVILGTLTDGRIELDEVHRFSNGVSRIQGSLRWNVLGIFEELKSGLRQVASRGVAVSSLSVDSWGVDYVLFNKRQPLVAAPYQYRDARTESTYAKSLEQDGREVIFAETGIQFMSINTLYHLIADVENNPDTLSVADQFLNIADYFNYLFCGVARSEVSLASTTQIYNPTTHDWSTKLIDRFSLPKKLFPEIVPSGTRLGQLTDEIMEETGLWATQAIATCSHDTGSAVAAVPAQPGDDWAYLSSGTWSLIGVELPEPLINDSVLQYNYTNEAGYGGTTRFLKNIVGLWLLQESRRLWQLDGTELDYSEINRLASEGEPFRSIIDAGDPRFLNPKNMPRTITKFCRETGQPEPETHGQFARTIFESLALLYAKTLDTIEQMTGRTITKLHIVGGGSQSQLLNQFTADASGRTVLAGPVEATAIGNVLIQAIAMGELKSLDEVREIVGRSCSIDTFSPSCDPQWKSARERLDALTG
ncbi:Rhamnulokinase [Rubripirellula tenax]|uniref:Rhamnulokinase n=1 Tax=Rubripirellula tenax TaxID=2528015 RepID=A0A5C6EET4_9BACT|nr:rhamnulokinase family protein [Rubripirellula tenax]TWU46066.1 Rhamnulokinase [Rubripirellula tenax]